MTVASTFRSPRQIVTGDGAVSAVGRLARQHGERAVVITDPIMAQQSGFDELRRSLDEAGVAVEVFAEDAPEVPLEVVERTRELVAGFEPAVLIAFGGGSVLDLTKVTAVMAAHGGHPSDYYGEGQVPGPVVPIIAVPTTAGTGSEVTPVAVVADPERALKVGLSSVYLIPEFAVCDARVTLSCPPAVTAHSGIDALCHAVESYTSPVRDPGWEELTSAVFQGKNPLSDALGRRAVAALAQHLPTAVEHGDDLDARRAVMQAATQAGLAFGHAGVGAPHALQFPLGSATGTPHGLGVGLFLPYVLTANRPAIETELAELAGVAGLDSDDPDAFIAWVVELKARIGIPASLQELGVERSALRGMAETTSTIERLLKGNRGDNSIDGLERVLVAAWEGDRGRLE